MPPDPITEEATEWMSKLIPKLQYGQDYFVYPGSSKPIMKDGEQVGLSIKREDLRFYSTGVTKLYRMLVLGEELADVVYTESQNEQYYKELIEKYPELVDEEIENAPHHE